LAVAVSPDGLSVVSASVDTTLKLWDLESDHLTRTLEGHDARVIAVTLTPDGQRVVSASADQTLKVWDLHLGELVATFTGESLMECCAVAPDGVTIVAGDGAGGIHFVRLMGILDSGSALDTAGLANSVTRDGPALRQLEPNAEPVSGELMSTVRSLLESNRIDEALRLLHDTRCSTSELQNARGVCLLRKGNVQESIQVFRSLAIQRDGLFLVPNTPPVFATNLATALILSGNINGALTILDEVNAEDHPLVVRLRTALEEWKKNLSFLDRVQRS